jgi:hypothetical protein
MSDDKAKRDYDFEKWLADQQPPLRELTQSERKSYRQAFDYQFPPHLASRRFLFLGKRHLLNSVDYAAIFNRYARVIQVGARPTAIPCKSWRRTQGL